VALTKVDRALLERCLEQKPGAWSDFVDRFLGLIYHVIHHTAHLRSVPVRPEDIEDLAAEVMLRIIADNYKVLRQFRGESSLATYLTVIARRICIEELARRGAIREAPLKADGQAATPAAEPEERPKTEYGLETLVEVNR
jgi:RNA polymerase sigma-70 factor (ECF subfamily)